MVGALIATCGRSWATPNTTRRANWSKTRPTLPARAQSADAGTVGGQQREEALGSGHRLRGRFGHAVQEKAQPALPFALGAHGVEALVVLRAVLLEVEAQVKAGFAQHALHAKDQRDQQAAQATIAVLEGMDGFELHVGKSRVDQGGACSDGRCR